MENAAPKVSVVLPTYNEAESLPVIVPKITQSLRDAGVECEVIVVDDNSPDGTAQVGRELSTRYPVRVIQRVKERGLATAVLAGFAASEAPVCLVMDADGSHPTSILPEMVRLIDQDKADIVVGSRHVPGGGSANWPLFSQLKSKLAATLTIGVTSMTDPTTGFMAVRRDLLAGLSLDPVGWKIALEIVVKAAPVRVAEVPIVFEDRELGESKQSLRVFVQYAEHLAKLYAFRFPGLAELVRFCIVGFIGLLVDLTSVAALKEALALDTRLCAAAGFAVAVSSNFLLNRRFTFARARELPSLYSYFTYVGVSLVGLAVRILVVHALMVLTALEQGRGYLLSNFIGIVLATLVNFLGAKYFAFDPQRTAPSTTPEPPLGPSALAPPRALTRGAAALTLIAALMTGYAATFARDLRSDDEGVNLVMARNIASDPSRALRPSVYPGGRDDFLVEDLPAIGNTPFFAWMLAPFTRGGLALAGLLPWLSLWTILLSTALLFWRDGPRAALYGALLLGSSPAFLMQALELELEPTMTALCAAGLAVFVGGTRKSRPLFCAAGGALLGLGFLTKLWLVLPYALAAAGFVLVHTTLGRARAHGPIRLRRSVVAAIAGFVALASVHLVLVLLLSPGDLGPWVSSVYFGIVSGEGITAGKLSAQGPWADAVQGVWYYPLLLLRDHAHVLALTLLGLPALLRRLGTAAAYLAAMSFGALLAIVPLSVPAVKEPLFVLAVLPLGYSLAGAALAELEADASKHGPANRALARVIAGLALILALLAPLASLAHGLEQRLIATVSATVLALATLLVTRAVVKRSDFTPSLLVLATLGLVAHSASVATRPPAPEPQLARALGPWLASAPPAHPSFVASRDRVLMGYLGRAGSSWHEWLQSIAGSRPPDPRYDPVLFVVDEQGLRTPGVSAALERLKLEEPQGLALPPGYRVLVRR